MFSCEKFEIPKNSFFYGTLPVAVFVSLMNTMQWIMNIVHLPKNTMWDGVYQKGL